VFGFSSSGVERGPAFGFSCEKRVEVEQFHEARLVRITHGGFAIWLDPFGMLDPQVAVNLLPKLGVGVDLLRHRNWLIWKVHL